MVVSVFRVEEYVKQEIGLKQQQAALYPRR
jgi:hypothetical protein